VAKNKIHEEFGEDYRLVTETRPDGSIYRKQVFDLEENLHNDIKPAVVEYYPNGRIKRFEFYQRNKLHRENNAAIEVYSESGRVHLELHYYHHGLLHRDPQSSRAAVIYSAENGCHTRQEFWNMGVRHRKTGPAVIIADPVKREIIAEEFYRQGKKIPVVAEESFMRLEP